MGIEWEAEDQNCIELINQLNNVVIPNSKNLKNRSIPNGSGIGIKPVSKSGSQRHIKKAMEMKEKLIGLKSMQAMKLVNFMVHIITYLKILLKQSNILVLPSKVL